MVHVAAQNVICDNLKYLVEQYQADLTAIDKVQGAFPGCWDSPFCLLTTQQRRRMDAMH